MEKRPRFGLRLKYIIEDEDRHGNIRIYVRKPGQKKIRIRGLPGSTEFHEAYRQAIDGALPAATVMPTKLTHLRPGTFAWLCRDYCGSAEFRGLDTRTQRIRRNTLDRICVTHGDKLVSGLEIKHIVALRDSISAGTPEAANTVLKVMRQVLARGVLLSLIKYNHARDVKYLPSRSEGIHTWNEGEIAQFQAHHPIGSQARLAMSLMLFLGQRKSDAVKFHRQQIRNGRFYFTQTKNRARKHVEMSIPIANELQKVLDSAPKNHIVFLVNEWGRPFTANGFGNKFRKWCDEAGLPQCSSHGLRKACATILANLGCSEMEIRAVTGHRSAKQVSLYTRDANLAALAAEPIAKLDRYMAGLHQVPPAEPITGGGTEPAPMPLKGKG